MTQPIRPEQLRHVISIQKKSATPDEYGHLGYGPYEAENIRAYVNPTGGSEFYAAQKVNAEATANIWIRYNSCQGVKSEMHVLYGIRVFDILVPVNWQERNTWYQLVCKEVV